MTRCHLAAFEVDGQVADELLPVSAAVTPLNLNDPNYGMSDDEIAERNEFIRWHMQQEYIDLMMIPDQDEDIRAHLAILGLADSEQCFYIH